MESKKRFGEIISKCWGDAAFKARFISDPKKVLAEYDIEVPEGLDVKVLENTNDLMYLTIPPKPDHSALSDDQLDQVSGGAGNVQNFQATKKPVLVRKFHTQVLVTSAADSTCSQGKECVPW
jgi:hypothetical protein